MSVIWRWLWRSLGVFLVLGCIVFQDNSASALDWPVHLKARDVPYVDYAHPCAGWRQKVAISGESVTEACITGDRVKLARYYPVGGGVAYAVQFASDPVFYGIDGCDVYGCSLSDDGETFVSLDWYNLYHRTAKVYTEFSSKIEKYVHPSGAGWRFRMPETPALALAHPNGSHLFAASSAVSPNGKWAVVEVKSYGIFLINTETLQTRRVLAPGFTYGLTNDPTVEMAVMDDGSQVAIMGKRIMPVVLQVTDDCGDRLSLTTEQYYRGAVTGCPAWGFELDSVISGFDWASQPSFNTDGSTLSFLLYSRQGIARYVTATSKSTVSSTIIPLLGLGDSFTSGEGETDDKRYIGTAKNLCHVSNRSYPYKLGIHWNVAALNAACSGATIRDILESGKRGEAQLTKAQYADPEIILVGIGGNDAGLMGKLSACVAPTTCEWATSAEARAKTAKEISSLYPTLRSLYTTLKQRTQAKVVVVGYPFIISTGQCGGLIGLLFDQTERQFMEESLRYLNAVLARAATDSGVRYIDASQVYGQNRLCDSTQTPAMNGVRLGGEIGPIKALPEFKVFGAESFHPTPFGHEVLASQIRTAFPTPDSVDDCTGCPYAGSAPPPSSYWAIQGGVSSAPTQKFLSFTSPATRPNEYSIELPAHSFAANQIVTIEVHSEPRELAKQAALANGGLASKVQVPPDIEPGTHSIHLKGLSVAGEPIEYYDFILVEPQVSAPHIAQTKHAVQGENKSGVERNNAGINEGVTVVLDPEGALPESRHAIAMRPSVLGAKQQRTEQQQPSPAVPILITGASVIGAASVVYLVIKVRRKHRV